MVIDSLELLKEFVSYDTVSSKSVMPLASRMASLAEDLGFSATIQYGETDSQKANVICRAGPHKSGGLILSGHMDVVPTEDQPWTSNPFSLTQRDDKLYGRGTADMKGFLACTIEALSRIDLKKLTEPLVLMWTYDEEVGCNGSHQLAHTLAHMKDEFPTEAIIGEPTDFRMFHMHPGHVSFRIMTTGLAAHSSKPHLGASAIKAMNQVLNIITPITDSNLNIGIIRGGQAVNIIADQCEIIVGYRPQPGDNELQLFKILNERIHNLRFENGITVEIKLLNVVPPLNTPLNTPIQKLLTPFASDVAPCATSFATDGGNLAQMGIQSIVFGPGSIDVAHQADEFIEISALKRGSDIVEQIIRGRCI